MALRKKKVVKKTAKKKLVKKKVVKKGTAKKKLKLVGKTRIKPGNKKAGGGKYAYEPYRAKSNVGNCAKNALLRGKETDAVLEEVYAEFPDSNCSVSSVAYYKTALRKEGYDI